MTKEQKTRIEMIAKQFLQARRGDILRALDDLEGAFYQLTAKGDKRAQQVNAVRDYLQAVYL